MTTYSLNGYQINIDHSRDKLLSEAGVATLRDRYYLENESSPQEVFARAACSFASNERHAQRLYDYASKCWFMFATPILSNAGNKRGLPISCFLNYVDDSMGGILGHYYESGFLASYGGGIGGDWSSLRPAGSSTSRGNTSTGLIPFVKMADTQMLAVQQGSTRRGAYAAYLDVSHPEIEEFLELRTVGGDSNRRCMGEGFHHGINITDKFMQAVQSGSEWNLVCPHTKEGKKVVDARTLWMDILIKRLETGEPYLFFTDTANRNLPKSLSSQGLRIHGSNLCTEIMLPTSPERTAVCCLSSVNVEHYDQWKEDKLFIFDIMEMLDNVLTYFIENAPKEMYRAIHSAKSERSIGIGSMGFALYLQRKGIPFESAVAVGINKNIFKHIRSECDRTNGHLAKLRGSAPDAEAACLRFSHVMAVAPNASTSLLCGNTSPSIEPLNSNAFKQPTMSGSFWVKNKVLDELFRTEYNIILEEELDELWSQITKAGGSVQWISWLKPLHKEIFKTAMELDQNWIIEHAAHRQPYIDQGQSVNLFLPPNVHKNELHKLHMDAWKKGLKSLYYLRSESAEKIKEFRNTTPVEVDFNYNKEECLSCSG